MNERQRELVHLALLYLKSNLDDAIVCFGELMPESSSTQIALLEVNGDTMDIPTEEELAQLLTELQ